MTREVDHVLGGYPIDVILLVKDLDRARKFYSEGLELALIEGNDTTLSFRCGGTRLKLSLSTTGTKDEQTQASWRVDDVRAAVAWLRSRGIEPQEYDTDEIKTTDGVADAGDAWVAWIMDPDANVLGIEQKKPSNA